MNRWPCRRCCVVDGACVLCGLGEHARCFQDWHRCEGGWQQLDWWQSAEVRALLEKRR